MPNPIGRSARLSIVALLVVACTGTQPTSAPPTVEPTATPAQTVAPSPTLVATPVPTAEPTQAPTPTPAPSFGPALLDATWTLGNLPLTGDVAVYTDSRWVALSDGCGGGCDSSQPTGLTSVDGITWTAKAFEPVDGPWPVAIAWNGGRVYGLGDLAIRGEPVDTKQAVIWDTADGSSWERIATIDLGDCAGTCLDPTTLAVSTDGVLVMGAGRSGEGGPSGIFRTDDGRTWTRVKTSAFGMDRAFELVDTIAIGKTIILAGSCEDCGIGLWSSRDGSTWKRLELIDAPMPGRLELASDGDRLVLVGGCFNDACTTTIWSGPLNGPFTRAPSSPDVLAVRLAAVGGLFVLAGRTDEGPHVFASVDGSSWSEQATTFDFGQCLVSDLAGGPASLLLFTSADCMQAWVGRLASARHVMGYRQRHLSEPHGRRATPPHRPLS
jgi:hypothetical protein